MLLNTDLESVVLLFILELNIWRYSVKQRDIIRLRFLSNLGVSFHVGY